MDLDWPMLHYEFFVPGHIACYICLIFKLLDLHVVAYFLYAEGAVGSSLAYAYKTPFIPKPEASFNGSLCLTYWSYVTRQSARSDISVRFVKANGSFTTLTDPSGNV